MKSGIFIEPGKMEVRNVPKPTIQEPTDAIIRVIRACVCGSDLWWFRGINPAKSGTAEGHGSIGVVEEVGSAVTDIHPGDFVIAPFTHGCGHCAACKAGFDGNCLEHQDNFSVANQSEYVRYPYANWALVKIPGKPEDYTDQQLNSLLTLADVMATGYHAAVSSEIKKGDTVAVIGDGAVGLCGVIGAKLLGAGRIISLSHHDDRAKLAREFGATDIVAEKGDEAVKKVLALTDGVGADAVLECVGATSAQQLSKQVKLPVLVQ